MKRQTRELSHPSIFGQFGQRQSTSYARAWSRALVRGMKTCQHMKDLGPPAAGGRHQKSSNVSTFLLCLRTACSVRPERVARAPRPQTPDLSKRPQDPNLPIVECLSVCVLPFWAQHPAPQATELSNARIACSRKMQFYLRFLPILEPRGGAPRLTS